MATALTPASTPGPGDASPAARVLEFLDALARQSGTSNPTVSTLVTNDGRVLALLAADVTAAVTAAR